MKKKTLACILAACMLLTSLTGCGKNDTTPNAGSSNAGESKITESTQNAQQEEKELITIEHLSFSKTAYQDNFYNYIEDSDIYKELVKQTGVQIEEYGLDNDQVQIRIASGDLGDLITLNNVNQLHDMVESGLVMPLNELIAEYAPEIMEQYPDRWAAACELYPNDEGLAYALPVRAGSEGWKEFTERYLYSVRWDLYKELGYPEMKTPDDLVKVLADMVKLQPTTAEGKKVYGAGFYVTDTSYFGMVGPFQGTYGYVNMKNHFVTQNVQTGEICYDMINEKSPYWMAVDFYNKAYRAGILDPDSFTQQAADYDAKFASGESLASIYYTNMTYAAAELEKDPNSIKGFVNIPVEGTMCYQNANKTNGWENAAHAICVPTTCENPERVIQFIKYVFSEDGARLLTSGVQGIHWDYVDGVPVYNEETYKIVEENGEEYKKLGFNMAPVAYMTGIANAELHSDGYSMKITFDQDYMSRRNYKPYQLDYCEYYKVDYPIQLMQQMVKDGKLYDLSKVDFRVTLTENDEDISRIDSACLKIAIEAIPELVTAEDDAAFEAAKTKTLEALKAAGAEDAEKYYTDQWAANQAKYK